MISIVVPFYNEAEIVPEIHARLLRVLKGIGKPFEIVFVDDGSIDATFREIKRLTPVRAFKFKKNSGQTPAFACGITEAKGEIIVTLDGDLENQPEDIPALLEKLNEGFDVVSGWRTNRWSDSFLTRRLPSLVANWLISRVTGVKLHDHGCNLRAYRREVFDGIRFSGEMHRMLAAFLGMQGAKIAEIPVYYVPRRFGVSKYGLSRIFRVILDVLTLYFFKTYSSRPMHFFGYAGFFSMGAGFFTFLLALYLRIIDGLHFNRTPLPELIAIFIVVGFQFILMGLLAELIVRGDKTRIQPSYKVEEQFKNGL